MSNCPSVLNILYKYWVILILWGLLAEHYGTLFSFMVACDIIMPRAWDKAREKPSFFSGLHSVKEVLFYKSSVRFHGSRVYSARCVSSLMRYQHPLRVNGCRWFPEICFWVQLVSRPLHMTRCRNISLWFLPHLSARKLMFLEDVIARRFTLSLQQEHQGHKLFVFKCCKMCNVWPPRRYNFVLCRFYTEC